MGAFHGVGLWMIRRREVVYHQPILHQLANRSNPLNDVPLSVRIGVWGRHIDRTRNHEALWPWFGTKGLLPSNNFYPTRRRIHHDKDPFSLPSTQRPHMINAYHLIEASWVDHSHGSGLQARGLFGESTHFAVLGPIA